MRLPSLARLARPLACVLIVLFAGLAIATPAWASPKPHPSTSTQASASPLPPPTDIQAVQESNGTVDLSWKSAPVSPKRLGGYIIDRNDDQIAQLPGDSHGGPLTYTDPRPPVGTVTYTVASYTPSGVVGSPGVGATLNIRIAASSSTSSGSGSTVPGGITEPNFRGNNAPTAFEEYGTSANTVHETYGVFEDPFTRGLMDLLNIWWYMVTLHMYIALSFLAWGVTSRFYAPLAAAVSGVLAAYFKLPLWPTIVSVFIIAATVAMIPLVLQGKRTQIARSLGIMMGVLFLSVVTVAFNKPIVNEVMSTPVAAGDYVLGTIDQLIPVNDNGSQYNLSTKPTFIGVPLYQDIRIFQNEEWLSTVYPSECMLNFGSVTWSTTNYVPNDVPIANQINAGVSSRFAGPGRQPKPTGPSTAEKEGFDHLTYCEYLVRDNKYGGSEDSYLTSQVSQNATGTNGYIWDMFQGNDMPQHIAYAAIAMAVITVRAVYIDVLAGSFVLCEFILAVSLLKLGLFGISAMWSGTRPYVNNMLRLTYITWTIPIIGAVMAVVCLALSNFAAHYMQQYGWMWAMLAQLFIAVATLFAFFMVWRRKRKEQKNRIRIDDHAPGSGRGVMTIVEAGTAAAAVAATGGAAAPALAAGGASAIKSTAQRQQLSAAGSGPVPKQLPSGSPSQVAGAQTPRQLPPGPSSNGPTVVRGTVESATPTTSARPGGSQAPASSHKALPPANSGSSDGSGS